MHFEYSYRQTDFPGIHSASQNVNRAYERVSRSSTEDSQGHLAYPDYHHHVEEDAQSSLISQSLNADGTPKRPMNAFMIFARRRRPQVSAENNSMRTGEISKLLSREWNSMNLTEKQFYLDQAKQLKDTFNSKYPDYVYRRRPNNSRKRRRADATHSQSVETAGSVGANSEASASTDPSSVESGNFSDDPTEMSHIRAPPVSSSPLSDPDRFRQKRASYSYSQNDLTYPLVGPHDTRFSYLSSAHDRTAEESSTDQQRNSARVGSSNYYQPYPQPKGRSRVRDDNITSNRLAPLAWDSNVVGGGGRISTSSYLGNQHPSVVPQIVPPQSLHGHSQPPTSSHWPIGAQSSSGALPTLPTSYSFPTLSSPFHPDASHMLSSFSDATSLSHSSHLGSEIFSHTPPPSLPQLPTARRQLASNYDLGGYHLSPATAPARSYPRDAVFYDSEPEQQPTRLSRTLTSSHALPPHASLSHLGAHSHST